MAKSLENKYKLSRLIILLFVLCIPFVSHATPPKNIKFERLSINDGLSNPIVFDLVQDRTGFIWIATNNGLNKFDGYHFKTYLPDNENPGSPKTVSSETIIKLMVDSHGLLWVGAIGGLDSYDPKTGIFSHYSHEPNNPNSISHNSIYNLNEDGQGNIWIATLGGGLNSFNRKTKQFTHYRHDPQNIDSIGNDKVYSVLVGKNNDIWIGLDGGLDHLDIRTGKFKHFTHDPNNPESISPGIIPGLLFDSNDYLWATSFGGGLNRYDQKQDRFFHYRHDPDDPYSLSYDDQIRIFIDSNNNLWIPTHGGGLDLYDPKQDHFVHYRHDSGNISSLSLNTMVGGFEDRSGVLWFFTYGGGLSKYDPRTDWFELITSKTEESSSLSSNDIHAIYEDSDGIIWIGTESGMNRYDKSTKEYKHYLNDPNNIHSISGDSVWAIDEDSQGYLWIATNSGFSRMDRKSAKFIQYRHDPQNTNSLNEDRTWSLCVDNNDEVWIGTQSGGVNRFNPETGEFKSYEISNFVLLLKTDRDGDIWVGAEKGLFKYNHSNDQFSYYGHEQDKPGIIGPGTVGAFLKDSRGNIWTGNPTGLYLYDRENDSFIKFTHKDGLVDKWISGIVEEKPGVIWVSTARGLSRYNYDEGTSDNFNVGTFNRGVASIKTSTGDILFGTPNGLFHLYPDKIQKNKFIPPVVLTSFKVSNHEIETEIPLSELKDYSLSYKDLFFSLEFSALDYSNTEYNQYKYKLEGFDNDWISLLPKRHFASYTNLSGGEYVFRVKGSNNDGIWNENGVSLNLHISSPFWETTWFYCIVVLLVIVIIYFVVFYINRLTSEITERKRAEESLLQSEEKFRSIFEYSPLGVIHFDKNGHITECNEKLVTVLGSTKEQLIGFNTLKYVRDEDMKSAISAALSGEIADYEGEYLSVTSGKKTYVKAHFSPSLSTDAAIIGAIGVLEDISEIKKAQEEKDTLEDRLQQAQKMEAIGTLAGGIAHDFNNILSIILGYTEMAQADAPPGTEFEKDLGNVLLAANRAKDLVKQILAFSRQAQVERIPLEIQPLIKEGLKMLRSSIPSTIRITENIDPKCGVILADPTQTHQIFINLCTNAYHAMDETGGELSVALKTTVVDSDDEELLLHVSPGEYIEFTVTDSGSGIGPDVIERIFDPYFTTKEVGKGTGMGLAIIHGIMKEYGGAITVESELGKGSTFHVYFPVIEKELLPEIEKSEDIPKGKERILFVDDERLLAEMGKDMLERLGYNVIAVSSSIEALTTFQNTPDQFDLVITDQTMPDMTGSDLAKRMIQTRPNVPIILCTGHSNLIDENSAKVIGIKGFALKPLTKDVIAKLIRKVLDGVAQVIS